MAQRIERYLVDDITGDIGDDIETIRFSLGKENYVIDLSLKNREMLATRMEVFIQNGRRVANTPGTRNRPSGATSDAAQVRAWAKSQGIVLGERGRIPAEVRQAYYAGHPKPQEA